MRCCWNFSSGFSFLAVLIVALALLGAACQSPLPGPALPGQGRVSEMVSGDWIALYFTAPNRPAPSDQDGMPDAGLVALIGEARERINMAVYELNLESVAEALIQAHQQGVRVRLVTDGTNADDGVVSRIRQAGIPVVARPLEGRGIMHNKFVVVDGQWVWTGSWNPTEGGTYRNDNNAVLIASRALARDYDAEFEELFGGQFGPTSPAETPYPLVEIEGQGRPVQVEAYFAPEDGVADRLLQLLSSARSHVRFLAFQFTAPRLADALVDLVGEGVDVEGVMEAQSAESTYSQYNRLQAGGVEVFLDGNPYLMHHKVLIVDDQVVALGSYNFTTSADKDNDENLLIIHDSEVAGAFLAEFERVLGEAER